MTFSMPFNLLSRRWLILLLMSATCVCRAAEREELSLGSDWRFSKGDPQEAALPAFDDSGWERISVPHTWNVVDGSDGGGYYRGPGWYRREVEFPAAWKGRQVFVEFDAANRVAEVFVNGERLGEHRGGYARFRFNATAALKEGEKNTLAVRVSNAPDDNVIPVSGDFTFFGGLYRGVRLVATAPVHLELLDYGSPGVYVIQQHVSTDAAELELRMKLANDREDAANVRVVATLTAPDGTKAAEVKADAELAAYGRGELRRRVILRNPRLWLGKADPSMYRLDTVILQDGKPCDSVSIPVGLRSFSVDPLRGFSLNGQPYELRGVNRHQDRAGKGYAISEADEREDFALIEELGATMIRQSHYQQSQLWNDLADRRGLVMWAEIPLVFDVLDNRQLAENAKEQLRELIRQNHHHPAILFWGIGNEVFIRDPKSTPADTADRLLREVSQLAREEDRTRLTVYASNGTVAEPRAGAADLVGFNQYYGWYHSSPELFADWVDSQHALRPDLCIGMSEYGAGANPTQHEFRSRRPAAGGPWHPEEWQAVYHEVHWRTLAERPWLWCKLNWCMFDLGSDGRHEGGTPGINDKGLVSYDRKTKKDAYFFYQANWSSRPVLHLTSQRFVNRTEPVTPVKVYSNAQTVALRVNGVELGSRSGTDHIFTWPEVALTAGENRVEVTATIGDQQLHDECIWSYTPRSVQK